MLALFLMALALMGSANAMESHVEASEKGFFAGAASSSVISSLETKGAGAWADIAAKNLEAATKRTTDDAETIAAVAAVNAAEASGETAVGEAAIAAQDALRAQDEAAEGDVKSLLESSEQQVSKAADSAKEEVQNEEKQASSTLEQAVSKAEEQGNSAQEAIQSDETNDEAEITQKGSEFEEKITQMQQEAEQKLQEAADAAAADRKAKEDAMAEELQAAVKASALDRDRLDVAAKRAQFKFESARDTELANLDGKFQVVGIQTQRLQTDAQDAQKESGELTEEIKRVTENTAESRAEMTALAKAARVYRIAQADAAARESARLRMTRRKHLSQVLNANRKLANKKLVKLAKLQAENVNRHRWEIENNMATQRAIQVENARASALRSQLAQLKGRHVQAKGLVAVKAKEETLARARLAQSQIASRAAEQKAELALRTRNRLAAALVRSNQNLNTMSAYQMESQAALAAQAAAAQKAAWAQAEKIRQARLGAHLHHAILGAREDLVERDLAARQYAEAQYQAQPWYGQQVLQI
jgi:hypothetical protein